MYTKKGYRYRINCDVYIEGIQMCIKKGYLVIRDVQKEGIQIHGDMLCA